MLDARSSEFATASSAVVVAVDAERRAATAALRGVDAGGDLRRQRAAVRVAQADAASAPASAAAAQARERVLGIAREAVEEVLGVEDHLVDAALQDRRPSRG